MIFAGGAFVEPANAEFFYRIGIPIVIGYGLTEAGTVLTVNDLKPFRSDTVGKPLRSIDIEIRDRNEGGIGEVWAKGPTVMKGYLNAKELTDEVIVDGWLRTGDLGIMDAAGHLKLVGRAKNMIVTEGGKNIYPEDIENIFGDVPGVQEHAVFAANYIWPVTNLRGEKLVLIVKPKAEHAPSEQEIRIRNEKLPDFKRIGGIVTWEKDFPRTASMKLKRDLLAQAIRSELDREKAIREI